MGRLLAESSKQQTTLTPITVTAVKGAERVKGDVKNTIGTTVRAISADPTPAPNYHARIITAPTFSVASKEKGAP